VQISTLESILQSAQGTLRNLLGEGAETPRRQRRCEPPQSGRHVAGCRDGRGRGLMLKQKLSPAGVPLSTSSKGKNGSPLTRKGAMGKLLPPRGVPGAPWSLSQAKRIDWLPSSGTTTATKSGEKTSEATQNASRQQHPRGGDVGLTHSTRKRVPGFSIGRPITASLSEMNIPLDRTGNSSAMHGKGKRGRRNVGGGGGGNDNGGGSGGADDTRVTIAGSGGEVRTRMQQQRQAKPGGSEGTSPCRECRNEKCWHLNSQKSNSSSPLINPSFDPRFPTPPIGGGLWLCKERQRHRYHQRWCGNHHHRHDQQRRRRRWRQRYQEAVAAAAASGENRAASGGVSEVRSVGGIGQGGRSGCSSSSSNNKVEGEEQDGEKKGEGGASSHHLISGSAMALAAACPAENVMSDGGNCCCCAASCWFACSCACHNVAASSAAVAAGEAAAGEAAAGEAAATGTGEGGVDRRRHARDGCPRRKRRRNGRELSSEPHRRDNKGARVTVAARDLDVKRAFLATSECGAGPRVVHFGKAARYSALPLFGQRGGGGGTPGAGAGAGAAGSGEVTGAKTSYDLSSAEVLTLPKVKGFFFSRRARDPVQARAESAATALLVMAERFPRAPCSTVDCGSSGGSPSNDCIKSSATRVDEEDGRNPALPVIGDDGDEPSPEAAAASLVAGSAAMAAPTRASDKLASSGVVKESRCVPPAAAAATAGVEADGGTTGDDTPQSKQATAGNTGGLREATTVASPTLSATAEEAAAPRAQQQHNTQQHRPQCPPLPTPSPPTSAVRSAPATNGTTGETFFLSHRPKVRAVVFPRPHTHQARKRPARRPGDGREGDLPGPGEYDVGGAGGSVWGEGARRPCVAPKRIPLKEKARAVVETRKAKEACLGGPGEYDTRRAEDITRTRRVVGVVSMHPPPPKKQVQALDHEIANRKEAWSEKGRRVGGSRSRSHNRRQSRKRNKSNSRMSRRACRGRTVSGGRRAGSRRRGARRSRSYAARRSSRPSSQSEEEERGEGEQKGGEETEKDGDRVRYYRSDGRSSSSKGRNRNGSFRFLSRTRKGSGKRKVYFPRSRQRHWRVGNRHASVSSSGDSARTSSSSSSSLSPTSSPRSKGGSIRRRGDHYHRCSGQSSKPRPRRRWGAASEPWGSASSSVSRRRSSPSLSSSSSSSSSSRQLRGGGRRSRRSCSGGDGFNLRDRRRRQRRRTCSRGSSSRQPLPSSRRGHRRNRSRHRNSRVGGIQHGTGRRCGRRTSRYRRRGRGGVVRGGSSPSSPRLSSSRSSLSGRSGSVSRDDDEEEEESEMDGVWRGFLAVSRSVPGCAFARLERKGVGDKNRKGIERARLQREWERTVGYHDVRRSLTEERAPSAVNFAAQAEAMARERKRVQLRRRHRSRNVQVQGVTRAWASECEDKEPCDGGGTTRGGRVRGQSADDPTRRRPPAFRYVEDKPLPPPAARRLAEREAAERKRDDWLDVNIHRTWWVGKKASPRQSGVSAGANGGGEFGRATGREKVEVKKKGEARIKPFDQALRPVDAMGPGRYETEDMARATRTGRLGQPPVPGMAVGLAREDAVGPRGERPRAAAEMERQETEGEGEEGGVLMLDVRDDVTTRRRRVPGGVLPSAPRWTVVVDGDDGGWRGEALDIEPEIGRDRVGPRRDKGHRYLRFETQAGRSNDTPPAATGLSPGVANGFGFGLEEAVAAAEEAEGDVLVLDLPRNDGTVSGGDDARGGRSRGGAAVFVDLEKQVPRWPEEGHSDAERRRRQQQQQRQQEQQSGSSDINVEGDVLVLDPDETAVRRRPVQAPSFEKQVGWRERQASDALESRERLRERREAWGRGAGAEAERGGGGRGRGGGGTYGDGDDPVDKADRARRPRARTTLVDIEKQQPQRGGEGRLPQHDDDDDDDDDDGIFFQPPPELAYRDADYDTDPGVSMTRRRTGGSGMAVVDMLRSTGRERGVGLGGGGGGEELVLSPKWSFLATRSSQPVAWHRNATTPRFAETPRGLGSAWDGEEGEKEEGAMMGLDLAGVEAARANVSRWRGSAVAPLLDLDMSKTEGRPSSLFGISERHPPAAAAVAAAAAVFTDDELRDDRLMEGQRLQLNATTGGTGSSPRSLMLPWTGGGVMRVSATPRRRRPSPPLDKSVGRGLSLSSAAAAAAAANIDTNTTTTNNSANATPSVSNINGAARRFFSDRKEDGNRVGGGGRCASSGGGGGGGGGGGDGFGGNRSWDSRRRRKVSDTKKAKLLAGTNLRLRESTRRSGGGGTLGNGRGG
ncbi:unnamed protein product, partial [Pylaiella littoralis]